MQHYYSIRVFINGFAFLEQSSRFAPCLIRSVSNDTEIVETNKREGLYSFISSTQLTVAIELTAQHAVHNHTSDPFIAHMVFFSFSSPPYSLLSMDSEHKKDFYAHPLSSITDGSRRTAWWFKGGQADVQLTFANPLFAVTSGFDA